jgi:membrane fusion protein, peptide pheromone/bacteriocin exporter
MELLPDSVIHNSIEVYSSRISRKSRVIYMIIIVSLTATLASLPLVSVDISVQARGLFQSDIEKQIITAPVNGRVSFTSIRSGDKVVTGDTIFTVDAGGLEAQLSALESIHNENQRSVHDLEKLTPGNNQIDTPGIHDLLTPRYISELESYRRQVEMQIQIFQSSVTEYRRDSVLFMQSVISRADYERTLSRYQLDKENIQQIKLNQQARWHNDLATRYDEKRRLEAEIDHKMEEIGYRTVRSPVSGTIIQSSDIQIGSFIAAGQIIAEISPESELVAIFFVNSSDIGFIEKGQTVRLQVDAYNYHQWGMLEGKISEISDDVISDNSSAFFRIKCKPEKAFLQLRNGVTSEVSKGMTFTARVMVTRRSLFELLFDKADKWFNPYSGKNQINSYAS